MDFAYAYRVSQIVRQGFELCLEHNCAVADVVANADMSSNIRSSRIKDMGFQKLNHVSSRIDDTSGFGLKGQDNLFPGALGQFIEMCGNFLQLGTGALE